MTPPENEKLIADLERFLEDEREFAVNSPMPTPESAAGGVYCEAGCHDIKPKYAIPKTKPKTKMRSSGDLKRSEAAVHLK